VVVTSLPIGERRIVMSVSVCVSVREYSPEPLVQTLSNFLRMLFMAVARSFRGCVLIRYVLPVLWITSSLWPVIGDAKKAYTQTDSRGAKSDI